MQSSMSGDAEHTEKEQCRGADPQLQIFLCGNLKNYTWCKLRFTKAVYYGVLPYDFPLAMDVVPENETVEVVAAGEKDAALGLFCHPMRKANIFFGL